MKKIYNIISLVVIISGLVVPGVSFAAAQKTLTGVVTSISISGIAFTNSTAATYTAELGAATLLRKNGATMQFSEIAIGDRLRVSGTLWGDNSISATSFTDLSLYPHNSSFSGKITAINPADLSFTMQSKQLGNQNVATSNFTAFSKNGSSANFKSLQLGMEVTVKAMWNSQLSLTATKVQGSFRLIDIYFTGTLSIKNGNSLTVIGNGNVIYGVDISSSSLENKSGKPAVLARYNIGDSVRIWGKHLSGSVQVNSSLVKDYSILN